MRWERVVGLGLAPPLLSFPPSGRGFAGSQTPNLKRGAGLHVSDAGHGTWQPQGWESSGAPAWSFPPWGQPHHRAQHPQAARPLPQDQGCPAEASTPGVSH